MGPLCVFAITTMFSLICQKHEGLTAFFSFARAPSVIFLLPLSFWPLPLLLSLFFSSRGMFPIFPQNENFFIPGKVPGLKQRRCDGESKETNSVCGFFIGCAFCPCGSPQFQLRGSAFITIPVFFLAAVCFQFSLKMKIFIPGKVLSWNRGVPMARRRRQILFAVFFIGCAFFPMRCATVSTLGFSLVFFLTAVCFQFSLKMKKFSHKAKSLSWNGTWVETGAFRWRAEGDKFCLRFPIGCAFCPMRLATVSTQGLCLVLISFFSFFTSSESSGFFFDGLWQLARACPLYFFDSIKEGCFFFCFFFNRWNLMVWYFWFYATKGLILFPSRRRNKNDIIAYRYLLLQPINCRDYWCRP